MNERLSLKGALTMGLFSALLAIVGCDRVATGELRAGQSTVADMKTQMGEPSDVHKEGDREIWVYTLGPQGVKTYFMTVDPTGKLEKIDQVLTEENFKRIVPGMTTTEVRRVLGKHGSEKRYAMSINEVTQVWKFNRDNADWNFEVLIDGNGRVKSTGFDDPSLQRGSSK
ncbi:MAG: outer membrane protein assembly factor BamE [Betaproteobacteria bacterium]|nr:MAG: outer membrane protein assembly factor BamE [Betaproteobacteria bacterium]